MCALVEKDVLYLADTVFRCGEIEKTFLGSLAFHQHYSSHNGQHPYRSRQRREVSHSGQGHYKCSVCGKAFSKKYKFTEHWRVRTGEKPYLCSDCGKFFRQSSSLIHHRKVHTGERPYECCNCGKVFVHKYKLFEHQRTHTGKRPYECTECGKAFARKDSLVQHQKIHTGENPHKCSECGKCFLYRNNLLAHQRIHSGEKPYGCSKCGKSFIFKIRLLYHQRVHTGEKPCAVNVGKPMSTKEVLLCIREFILWRRLMGVTNVENCLQPVSPSTDMRILTLHEGITSALSVGKLSVAKWSPMSAREPTLEKDPVSVTNVGEPSCARLHCSTPKSAHWTKAF